MGGFLANCLWSDCFYLDITAYFIGHFDVQTEELNTINLMTSSLLAKFDIGHSSFNLFSTNKDRKNWKNTLSATFFGKK